MDTQVTAWLNEGLKHFCAGDASRALEAWYRILEVEPQHAAALEYVAFVRETVRVDKPADEPAVAGPAAAAEQPPAVVRESPPAPPPTTSPPASPLGGIVQESPPPPPPTTSPLASPLDGSWADAVANDIVAPTVSEPPILPPVIATPDPAPAEPAPVAAAAATPSEPAPAPLPSPEPANDDAEPAAPPAIARWAYPKMQAAKPPEAAVENFEPLQPFELDVSESPPPPADGAAAHASPPTTTSPSAMTAPPPRLLTLDSPDELPMPAPSSAVATPPAEIQPAQLAARLTPQAAVVPALAPPPTVANIATTPAPPEPRSMAVGPIAIDDGPVRISVRFDEPRVIANPGIAVPSSNPLQPVPVPPPTSPRTSSANAAVEAPTDAASPWDAEGPTGTVDLDTTARKASPLETLLTTHAAPSTPPAAPAAEAPAAVPAKPVDELEALMTGAKELFDLGYFSGSLELVEKVLRKNPNHEGARAYLKRNESTLMRMYESKIGSMGTVPRQLVPPDEVIWLNMHHRAGFILSQVDGTLSYEDLLEISGMDRFDTVRILAELVQNGIIGC